MANNPYGEVTLVAKGQDRNYYYSSDESYEVARLQVKAGDTNVTVNGFTLTNMGSLDIKKYLNAVEVIKNGVTLKNVNFSTSNDKLLISFDPNIIQAKNTSLYVIKIKLEDLDKFSQTIQYKIANADDFDAVDANTNIPVEFVGWFEEVLLKTYQFNGDKITLSNGQLPTIVYGAAGSTDVVIAEGTVSLSEAIKLNQFTIVADEVGVENMRIIFDNNEYDGIRQADAKTFTFNNIYIEKAGEVKVKVDLYNDAIGTYTFTQNGSNFILLSNIGGKYDEYNQTIDPSSFIGSIKLSTLKVEEPKGYLTNKISKDFEVRRQEASRVVIFDGDYTARRNGIELNQFLIEWVNMGNDLLLTDYIVFYLYIDGNEVAYTNQLGIGDYFDGIEVEKDKTVQVKLEAELYLSNTGDYKYDLTLKWEDENGNPVWVATDSTIKIKVVNRGSVIVTEKWAILKDTVVKKTSDIELARFIIKAEDDSVLNSLEELRFSIADATANQIRVRIDGTDETSNLVTTGAPNYILSDINYDISENGVEVVITHRAELANGEYALTLTEVNGDSKNRTYKRYVVPALVSIKSQSSNDDETKFVFSVDKDSGDTITSVKITDSDDRNWTATNVENNDFIEVPNHPDSIKYIEEIEYVVHGDSTPSTITINRTAGSHVYRDFFKVGSTYAKIARAK